MLCEVEKKKFHLDPLTEPSLVPDVISHLIGCFEVGTVDLKLLIEDLMLVMMILKTLS